jgi:exonuclease I
MTQLNLTTLSDRIKAHKTALVHIVEQQHVWFFQQQAAQRHAAAFTTGELLNFCIPVRQTQGVSRALQLHVQVVTVVCLDDLFKLTLLGSQLVEVRIRLGVFSVHLVQAFQGVNHFGMFGAWRGNTSWVAPLAWHPENRNAVIMVDLAGDITPLLTLDSDTLRERLYTPKSELGELAAVPVKLLHINKCPVLAQANTLRPEDADRLGIDRQRCLDNLKVLRDTPQVREKVVAIFAEAEPFVPSDNVDAQLYNGFFSDADRAAMNIVLQTEPRNLPALDLTFADKRIEKLIFNYRARNYPGTLDENEQARWLQHRRNVFTPEYLQAYAQELEMLYGQYEGNNEKLTLLKALYQYAQEIV